MPRKLTPLLCELHAHTTWSDGRLPLRALVDLYGRYGFDVLCITDHTVRSRGEWDEPAAADSVGTADFDRYLAEIDAVAERARERYDLLVIPGLELTYDDPDPALAAHAVAVGLRSFVGGDDGLDPALHRAREHGAALIAAHPYSLEAAAGAVRGTGRWAAAWRELAGAVDRFELVNRHELFGWVGEVGLPSVATGDFHGPEHLATWKTLLPCRKDEQAVVAYLRSKRPAF